MRERKKLHYAWLIFAGCCFVQGASIGILCNSVGIFYVPVSADLGISVGRLSVYRSVFGIASAVMTPFVGRTLSRRWLRPAMTAAAVCIGLSCAAMGSFSQVWQWYAAGAVQGMASAFLMFIPVPVLLGNWFSRRASFLIGLSASFSGLMGILMNPVGSELIERCGWRGAYVVFGALMLVLMVPFTAFVLRFDPGELGLQPYGAAAGERASAPAAGRAAQAPAPAAAAAGESAPAEPQGYTLRQATHSVSFYLALLLSLCIGTACGLQGLTAPYGAAIGLSAASAALLASFSMVGNMTSKFLSGSLNERFGAYRTTFWLGVVSLAGFLLLWSGRAPLLQIGAAGSGAITCMNAVVVAYYTRALFGDKQYALIYPYVSITATMPSSLSISLFGLLYDKTGSYDLDFLLCAVCLAVLLVLLPVTFAVNRRERTRLSD